MKPKSLIPIIALVIGALIFSYIFTKASITSFTHDESFTYLHYPHTSFMELISFSDWFMNNHIMNSISMKYSEQLFGNSELALRLPNLLSLLIFLFYGFKLFQRKHPILLISVFILLSTNVMLIDLFGLARGYGLSCGFMVMSLYHFLTYLSSSKKINLYSFHFAALLAVLSHFTLLPFYVALLGIFSLLKLLHARFDSVESFHLLKDNKPHFFPLLINIIILYEPVRRALIYGQLNVGGKEGFFANTISDFVKIIMNGLPLSPFVITCLQIFFTLIVLIPFFISILKFVKNEESFFKEYKNLIVTNTLLLIILLILILNHHLLGADFPTDRFIISLFPLFIIQFGFFLDFLSTGSLSRVTIIVCCIFSLMGATSFIAKTDHYTYSPWEYDAETKNMIHFLTAYRKINSDTSKNVKIGINWLFEPTINFYRKTEKIDWLLPVDRNGLSEDDDYVYTFKQSILMLDTSKYDIIKNFKKTKTVLIKVKTVSNIE